MKLRLSKFYTRLYTVLLSVSGAAAVICLAMALIFKDYAVFLLVLFSMFAMTFVGVFIDMKRNGISAFNRTQLCKGGVCEFSANGKRKIKAVSWKNIAFVTVVSDYMTKQKWICFSKKRLSSEQMRNPLRSNAKCNFYVLYPYSERAYEVALEEVKKHRQEPLKQVEDM